MIRHPLLFRIIPQIAFVAGLAACRNDNGDLIVSGRVEMDQVRIGSRIGGRVSEVKFHEGDRVNAGDVVLTLEDKEWTAQLNQAMAARDGAQARLDLLLAGTRTEEIERAEAIVRARQAELELRRKGFRDEEIRSAEAQLARAKSDLELADADYKRAQTLYTNRTIDRQELDVKRTAFTNAQAQHEVAEQTLALRRSGSRPEEIQAAEAQLAEAEADLKRLRSGARPEEIAGARAAVAEAQALVERLRTQLEETRIHAPAGALIDTLDLRPGDLVQAGQPVAVLYLADEPYVRCYVPENRLGWVKPGMEVAILTDSHPGREFRGVVRRLNAEAEFTPRNVQTQEKRADLVFETRIDFLETDDSLRAGMYADAKVPRP